MRKSCASSAVNRELCYILKTKLSIILKCMYNISALFSDIVVVFHEKISHVAWKRLEIAHTSFEERAMMHHRVQFHQIPTKRVSRYKQKKQDEVAFVRSKISVVSYLVSFSTSFDIRLFNNMQPILRKRIHPEYPSKLFDKQLMLNTLTRIHTKNYPV